MAGVEGWINPGLSVIVDPDGKVVAGPLDAEEEILYAVVSAIDRNRVSLSRSAASACFCSATSWKVQTIAATVSDLLLMDHLAVQQGTGGRILLGLVRGPVRMEPAILDVVGIARRLPAPALSGSGSEGMISASRVAKHPCHYGKHTAVGADGQRTAIADRTPGNRESGEWAG